MNTNIIDEIATERQRQDDKWGEQNHDNYRWLTILAEEVGELSRAIIDNEFGGRAAGTERTELIQVVAVGIQWLECMDRNGIKDPASDLSGLPLFGGGE